MGIWARMVGIGLGEGVVTGVANENKKLISC